MTEEQIKEFKATMTARIPLGRIGDSDEIAKAVLFLAAPRNFNGGVQLCLRAARRAVWARRFSGGNPMVMRAQLV